MDAPLPPLPHEPRPGRYRHYKGNEYRVLGIARHSETLEPLVLYQALYGDTAALWIRPQPMFVEAVTVAGATLPRFKWIADA